MNIIPTSTALALLLVSCGNSQPPEKEEAAATDPTPRTYQGVVTLSADGLTMDLCSGNRLNLSGTPKRELQTAFEQQGLANPGSSLWASVVAIPNPKGGGSDEKNTRNMELVQVVSTEAGRDCATRWHGVYYTLQEADGPMSKMEMREDGSFDLYLAKPDGTQEDVAGTWKVDGEILQLTGTNAVFRFAVDDSGTITQQDVDAGKAIVLQRQ